MSLEWKVLKPSAFSSAAKLAAAEDKANPWRLPTIQEATSALIDGEKLKFSFGGATSLWTNDGEAFILGDENKLGVDVSPDTQLTVVVTREIAPAGPAAPKKRRLVVSGYMDSAVGDHRGAGPGPCARA